MNPENAYRTATNKRPRNAVEVAAWSNDLREFGYNFADWLHELEKVRSKAGFSRRIASAPPSLSGRFAEGDVADASLAAEIEHLCRENDIPCPGWVVRTPPAKKPWFPAGATALRRAEGYQLAPSSFRQRNLFYLPCFTLFLRPGRSVSTPEIPRAKSAVRSKRHREKPLLAAGGKKPSAS